MPDHPRVSGVSDVSKSANNFWRDFRKKEERRMKLTNHKWFSAGGWMGLLWIAVCLMGVLPVQTDAQAISTTTVQGTVYLANGQPGTGTLVVSWPSFTTASGQAGDGR